MFTNATFYRFPLTIAASLDSLQEQLSECRLKPVGVQEIQSSGFISPFGSEDSEGLEHRIGQSIRLTVGAESRILPAGVVNKAVADKIRQQLDATGIAPGGRARRRIKEEVIQELIPRAFVKPSRTDVVLLLDQGLMIVDTSSRKTADAVVSEIRRALGSFPATPLMVDRVPRMVLTGWLAGEHLPEGVTLNDECELKHCVDKGAVVRCQRQELMSDEITKHLESGKQCTRIGLVFSDRISGVLDEVLALRKLKMLDVVMDELEPADTMEAELDARFALFIGEIKAVFKTLTDTFSIRSAEPLFELSPQ